MDLRESVAVSSIEADDSSEREALQAELSNTPLLPGVM